MKLLSMSLALFFGAVLAITTDAAPGGLKKDGESSSVHRSLDAAADAEAMCTSLETFDGLGRGENNRPADAGFPGLDWSHCGGGNNLCPTEDAVAAICSAKEPLENPAVKKNWCIPSFAIIEDVGRRTDCVKWCTNYVSVARGDCCNIDCTP